MLSIVVEMIVKATITWHHPGALASLNNGTIRPALNRKDGTIISRLHFQEGHRRLRGLKVDRELIAH